MREQWPWNTQSAQHIQDIFTNTKADEQSESSYERSHIKGAGLSPDDQLQTRRGLEPHVITPNKFKTPWQTKLGWKVNRTGVQHPLPWRYTPVKGEPPRITTPAS